ncbi:N-acetyllactosaminide beta-1,3-N-acetylglucosaminyltransferase 2 [Misgurnus anguillicaudatus]|uniref:N-acetyllactosaminide beta-1,3-N-acetylglucosaminyltransferase 2 n=1 Tax=Misgurnus anguillicaudatus TaxID=75329 RepID=UPI002436136B|nr:N-acetyllactosaminide beta-1,3-N-acetylglucosaminyltransferase 2 [Misgurnus anguillicaudatus]XP_055031040.1 N-acetyllactosaminide beta-1,3-N-acetylglucosaminyltransferase 2 [Misgurnus anguillicaudatus]
MRVKYSKLLILALVSSLCLVVFYSKLKDAMHTQRDMIKNQSITADTHRKPTTADTHRKPRTTTVKPIIKKKSKNNTPLKLPQLTISEDFIKFIPKNGAFWNRKLHSLLRQFDVAQNQTHEDPRHWFRCQPESFELLQTNIQDIQSYPLLYREFLKGMECRDPPVVIDQPTKCESGNEAEQVFLLFAIKSSLNHFERRQAVRETWGREGLYDNGVQVRTVFLLGQSLEDDPNLDKLISLEAQQFQDLLVWDFQDSFYNLTLKEHVFFKWMLDNCPQVSFVFKGDDDVFANTQAILNHLHSLEPEQASSLYAGQIIFDATPLRDQNIKYYVPQTFYEGPYPPYAGGGGFLFSGNLLPYLYHVSFYIPFFPIDDVYTGMCFKALGITPVKHSGFQTFDIREQDRENACVHKDLLLVHQRTPQQTMRLWRNMHSSMLTC